MHASDPTDLSLLQRIAARDTAALAELYDRTAGCSSVSSCASSAIARGGGDPAGGVRPGVDASRDLRRADGRPLAWIVRVARNCSIDRLRARRVRAHVDTPAIDVAAVEALAIDIQTPEAAVLDAERRLTLTDALAGLPAEQRQLIEAAFFEGYTHSELAQRFGLPLGTVKTRIRAGVIAMRKSWSTPYDPGRHSGSGPCRRDRRARPGRANAIWRLA